MIIDTIEVPMTVPTRREEAAGDGLPPGTRLESVEDLRRAAGVSPPPTAKEAARGPETTPFRPVRRPPMALLRILDDGSGDGEEVRIRLPRLVIGRTEGDVLVPHDDMISGRHAAILREAEAGRWRWVLTDLDSTNGTFVRVSCAALQHGQELLLGGRRYQFHLGGQGSASDETVDQRTKGWHSVAPADVLPSLVEWNPGGPLLLNTQKRYFLDKPDLWLGRDARRCGLVVDDPMLDPRHARFQRDGRGRWLLSCTGTVNGLWVRVNRVPVEEGCQFQLGEQRFLLRVL